MGLLNRTRPRVELLQLMLDNIKIFELEQCRGLCSFNRELRHYLVISSREFTVLDNYIDANPPAQRWSSIYYWEPDLIEPRIEWIKQHIKLHLEEN